MAKSIGRPKADGARKVFAGQSRNVTGQANAPNGKAPLAGRSSKHRGAANDQAYDGSEQDQAQSRQLSDGPWLWINCGMLREIAKEFNDILSGQCQLATARSVYIALCEIANEERSQTFSKPIGFIAARAGV